jgi:hypothetical protein
MDLFADTIDDLIRRYATAARFDDWVNQQAMRLGALPVGWDLWSHWFLRPSGEVIITDGEETVVCTDRTTRLQALVGGQEYYPELASLLPEREAGAKDCPCRGQELFVSGKAICPLCGGVGWLPANGAEGIADG